MTGKQFVDWMKKYELRVPDVASKTGLDPNTIYAFRRGEAVRRTTKDILLRFRHEYEEELTEPVGHGGKRATG